MKKKGLTLFLGVCLLLLSVSISFAQNPSQLIVVRASDNSLWKATCAGTSCTSFTSIPGLFTTQPAVLWDENLQEFVLWGRGVDGSIWRSTFNRLGGFNNDWVIPIPGSTPSPPGAAGGGLFSNFASVKSLDMSYVVLSDTVANIKSQGIYCPWDGFVSATGSGTVQHYRTSTGNTAYSRIYLSETSGGTQVSWSFTDVPPQVSGFLSFPFSETRWFTATAGAEKYIYLTGEGHDYTGTGSIEVYNGSLDVRYYPYSY
jgi:hypothetical protein